MMIFKFYSIEFLMDLFQWNFVICQKKFQAFKINSDNNTKIYYVLRFNPFSNELK